MGNINKAEEKTEGFFQKDFQGKELIALYKDIFNLAIPAFIGQGFSSVVWFTSVIIIGRLGEKAFNSVNIGMMIFYIIVTIVGAIGVGTTSLVAQYWGKGDKRSAGDVLQQSLIYGVILSINILLFGLALHKLIFNFLGVDSETVELGSQFLFWIFLGVPFITPGFFLGSALRGAGDAKTPMYVGVITGLFTLFLQYGLILGHFGLPRLGVKGAALAIDISYFINSLILAFLIFTNKTRVKVTADGWRPKDRIGKSIFSIGMPSALEWTLIEVGILLYAALISKYGAEALAGYFAGLSVLALAQTASFGFQTAATTLVGQAVGAQNYLRAESIFRKTSVLGFIGMGILGIIIASIASPSMLQIFFNKLSLTSIEYSRTYILLLVLAMPLMGFYFSIAGGLRGAGDTVWPLICSMIGVFGGRLLFAAAVYYLFHPPVYLIWGSLFIDLGLRISLVMIRLRNGKWKKGRI